MKVAFLDVVHPVLEDGLRQDGHDCIDLTTINKEEISQYLRDVEGIVIRSRIPMNKNVLDNAPNLKFIARSGAGMENIDIDYCNSRKIKLFNAPEGNRNAVAEHALGMLLSLFNNLCKADREVRKGKWDREGNRGIELNGKTVGIIGYGNNGSALAKKLRGFDVDILAYDKYKSGFGDDLVKEVGMDEIFQNAHVVSLHIPQNEQTIKLVSDNFIDQMNSPFYLINLSRGKIVDTEALMVGIESGKVLGACLDVLEYESSSFEGMFESKERRPIAFSKLLASSKVVLSPHVGGWTIQSYYLLSKVLLDKIRAHF